MWLPMAPNGRRIPVNAEPNPVGQLMLDEPTGWLVRAFETNQVRIRYRSHLLDCKSLAHALHSTRVIAIGKDEPCEYPGCIFKDKHSHVHCYRCGEAGHYASACEAEDEVQELVFDTY